MNIIDEIDLRFKSGNEIPITSILLTKEMWDKVKLHYESELESMGYALSDAIELQYID